MRESVTKMELHLLCRAAASGRVCPATTEEKEIGRNDAAQLTKAGWTACTMMIGLINRPFPTRCENTWSPRAAVMRGGS
jgi:hypothetical protein